MSNNYTDVTKSSLIINKLTRAQYEASSKDENQLWILTDVIDFQADLTENIYAPSKKYEGQITQHIGETSGKYIQGYFYKCVAVGEEPNITYVWQNINSQPAQVLNWGNIGGTLSDQSDLQGALDSKLTTTDDASKVYGTNAQGEQVLYDVNSFGQVDDVQLHGQSVVENKIADLSVVEQLNTIPTAAIDYKDRIIQYTGETNNTYTNGFFYKCIEIPGSKYVENDELMDKEGLTKVELDEPVLDSALENIIEQGTGGFTYINGVEVSVLNRLLAPIGDGSLSIQLTSLEQLASAYGIVVEGTPTSNTYLAWTIDDDPQPTYGWERVDVQPATDISGKVDKTTDASKVYGTDDQGNQTTYNVNDFGQIDNVAIHGIDQTITNKRVDLKVVEQEDSLPTASEDLVGRIVQYTGTTNQDYTHGYFYECKTSGAPSEAICTATDSSTLYPYHVTVDKDTFETQITTAGEYVFHYDGTNWTLNNNVISLDDYGISIQEGITYSSGDNVYINYTESTIDYSWSPIPVQTSTVFRRIVEE